MYCIFAVWKKVPKASRFEIDKRYVGLQKIIYLLVKDIQLNIRQWWRILNWDSDFIS